MWRVINSNTSQTSFWKFAGVSSTTSVPAYIARRGLARPWQRGIDWRVDWAGTRQFKMVIMDDELTRNTR